MIRRNYLFYQRAQDRVASDSLTEYRQADCLLADMSCWFLCHSTCACVHKCPVPASIGLGHDHSQSRRSTAGHLSSSAELEEDVRSPALLCAELRSTKFRLTVERLNVVFRVLLLTRVIYYLLTHFDALLFACRNTCRIIICGRAYNIPRDTGVGVNEDCFGRWSYSYFLTGSIICVI